VKLLGEAVARDSLVGTFTRLCAHPWRYGEAVGLSKSFTIYDMADQRAVVVRVERAPTRRSAVTSRRRSSTDPRAKQEGRGANEMRTKGWFDDAVANVYAKYQSYLRAANASTSKICSRSVVEILENPEPSGLRRRSSVASTSSWSTNFKTRTRCSTGS